MKQFFKTVLAVVVGMDIEAQLELADYLIDISKNSKTDQFSQMWEEFDKKNS